jgi:hypothetical protein
VYVDPSDENVVALIERDIDGPIVMLGEGEHFFVGPTEERWDLALFVRQNSLSDFFSFASNADYLAGIGHRSAAVEDTRLVPLVELPVP